MKKKFLLISIFVLSITLLTGCSNKNSSKESIESAKNEVEQIIADGYKFYNSMDQDSFEATFYAFGREFLLSIEEKNNNGDMIFIMFGDEEINGKKVGVDPDDKSIHYIYLGNEKYDDLWAHGTVDLKTKKITWEMSY